MITAINCQQVDLALNLSASEGNSILEIVEGWSKIRKIIYMNKPLTENLKNKIENQIGDLRYRKFDGSSHYPADEGFICDDHSIAISFPVKK